MYIAEFESTGNRMMMVKAISSMWLIEESFAIATEQMLLSMSAHDILEAKRQTIQTRESGGNSQKVPYNIQDKIAYIPINGVMTKELTSMEEMMGGVSMIDIQKNIIMAINDDDVDSLMLIIDSPGGTVDGVFDLAHTVYQGNKIKPIDGHAEDNCCSAAYLVGSQTRTFTANTNCNVGSIGAIIGLTDSTVADKQRGIKRYYVKTGEYKGTGFPGTEVTEKDIAYIQERVDSIMGLFVKAVSKGRNMDAKALAKVTNARVFIGNDAKKVGLIDGIMSRDQAHKNALIAPKKRSKGIKMSEESTQTQLSDTERWLNIDVSESPSITQTHVIEEPTTIQSSHITTALSVDSTNLLTALNTAGIKNTIELDALIARAQLGDEYMGRLRAQTERLAIVALGPEDGASAVTTINLLGANQLRAMARDFENIAVAKGVIPPLAGNPGTRTSASGEHGQIGSAIDPAASPARVADTSGTARPSKEERIAAATADLLANSGQMYHL